MRAPLSWLRDFAPFDGDPAGLAEVLDDLGLVVESVQRVGEGLTDVVVARVTAIDAIQGADRIRRVTVEDGSGPVEVVCGAWNFEVGALVPLAPVGAVLPGGFEITRRRMFGVDSNGMLCSGRELGLTDDAEGILVLDGPGSRPGQAIGPALGIEPDVVFDIAVEANRPDALSMAGIARDLAARLGLPFTVPEVADVARRLGGAASEGRLDPPDGSEVQELASLRVEALDLCPRFTVRVLTGVEVAPSPPWLSRRLTLAGMRPINNVVDASNYVMLETGQPTHPYDLDQLPGQGLVVRAAATGETVTTLDGVARTLGVAGPGLDDPGRDCLICDADGEPVGIGGVMGGASSEIAATTRRVLLESAYFDPMTIARTSKRLGLRTEASARFERGCDPAAVGLAGERFCELVALSGGPSLVRAPGVLEARGEVPAPFDLEVRPSRISGLLGAPFTSEEIVALLAPLGIAAETGGPDDDRVRVTVPTHRSDIRAAPMGEADIAEEVARMFGYSRIVRRTPSWPQPGRLTDYQRDRRRLRDILCGVGATEAWTSTFVTERDQVASGFDPPFIEVTNPLVESERFLRSSMAPGLVRAVVYNSERRRPAVRFFEIGSVFALPGGPEPEGSDAGYSAAQNAGHNAEISERLSALFAMDGDDAWTAVAAWRTIADALRLDHWSMDEPGGAGRAARALHPFRSAALVGRHPAGSDRSAHPEPGLGLGVVGELAPRLVEQLGLLQPDGRPRRVGWLDVDLGVLLDRERVPRRPDEARPVTRFPSSDVDLAFVVDEVVPAGAVARTLQETAADLLESVELFDVYRGPSVDEGSRSLAFRLRFSSLDHTLTDREVGELRSRSIAAVEQAHRARLR